MMTPDCDPAAERGAMMTLHAEAADKEQGS